jgi:hypothetical protein
MLLLVIAKQRTKCMVRKSKQKNTHWTYLTADFDGADASGDIADRG